MDYYTNDKKEKSSDQNGQERILCKNSKVKIKPYPVNIAYKNTNAESLRLSEKVKMKSIIDNK